MGAPFWEGVAASEQSRGATVCPEDLVEGEGCEGCNVAQWPVLTPEVSGAEAGIPTRTVALQAQRVAGEALRALEGGRFASQASGSKARPRDGHGSLTDYLSIHDVKEPTRHL